LSSLFQPCFFANACPLLPSGFGKDTVPVNVAAVVYWMVWDVEKAALEVEKYMEAVAYIAQTGLRDMIGKHELADLFQHWEKIGEGASLRFREFRTNGLQFSGIPGETLLIFFRPQAGQPDKNFSEK
jgi:SPFH domain / Band 7 family